MKMKVKKIKVKMKRKVKMKVKMSENEWESENESENEWKSQTTNLLVQKCVFSLAGKTHCPLIANLIGYSQCEDKVTKSEGKKTATGYISDLFA